MIADKQDGRGVIPLPQPDDDDDEEDRARHARPRVPSDRPSERRA